MALTTAQAVRLRVQDLPTVANETYYGDGTAVLFLLPHRNITSGTAYVPIGKTAWTATGASFDASGYVTFSGIIPANSAFRVQYVHSNFSDDEIGHFTAVGGTVNGAALEAVQTLMFDSLKRARWMSPDGTQHDDTQAQSMLSRMYTQLKAAVDETDAEAAAAGGEMQSWALEQENY
jgi:hypothetical protein